MGKELNINKMAYAILLFFIGLFCLLPVRAETVFIPGGVIIANNGGEPLSFSNPGGKNLNYVDSAVFRTKHIKRNNLPHNVICVDNIRDYFSSNSSTPNANIIILSLVNELGEGVATINQGSNQRNIETSEPINTEVTVSFSHTMVLKMYNIYKPFKAIVDSVYECAAYPVSGRLSDIKEITYYTLRISDLYTAAVPSISVDRTSLNLGVCQAGTGISGTLSGNLLITLGHEGDHRNLNGSLTAAVIGDTRDLTIRTASGHNLTESPLAISETATGDYPLTVSVPCPDRAGNYQWNVALTYTIE